MGKIHELKVITRFWPSVVDGSMSFQIRRNDRGYQVGDIIRLCEYDPSGVGLTGYGVVRRVTFILYPEDFPLGLTPGFVVLGLAEPMLEKFDRMVKARLSAKKEGKASEAYALKLELNAMLQRKPELGLGYSRDMLNAED